MRKKKPEATKGPDKDGKPKPLVENPPRQERRGTKSYAERAATGHTHRTHWFDDFVLKTLQNVLMPFYRANETATLSQVILNDGQRIERLYRRQQLELNLLGGRQPPLFHDEPFHGVVFPKLTERLKVDPCEIGRRLGTMRASLRVFHADLNGRDPPVRPNDGDWRWFKEAYGPGADVGEVKQAFLEGFVHRVNELLDAKAAQEVGVPVNDGPAPEEETGAIWFDEEAPEVPAPSKPLASVTALPSKKTKAPPPVVEATEPAAVEVPAVPAKKPPTRAARVREAAALGQTYGMQRGREVAELKLEQGASVPDKAEDADLAVLLLKLGPPGDVWVGLNAAGRRKVEGRFRKGFREGVTLAMRARARKVRAEGRIRTTPATPPPKTETVPLPDRTTPGGTPSGRVRQALDAAHALGEKDAEQGKVPKGKKSEERRAAEVLDYIKNRFADAFDAGLSAEAVALAWLEGLREGQAEGSTP